MYSLPECSVVSTCRSLSLHIRRNCMFRHDYYALLSATNSPTRLSVLRRYTKKKMLHAFDLVAFHSMGHRLPNQINLRWLFLAYDLVSTFSSVNCKVVLTHIQQLGRNKCKPTPYVPENNMSDPDNFSKITETLIGVGRSYMFSSEVVIPLIRKSADNIVDPLSCFCYVDHVDEIGQLNYPLSEKYVFVDIPLHDLIPHIPIRSILQIARQHHVPIGSHMSKGEMVQYFDNHSCVSCTQFLTVFAQCDSMKTKKNQLKHKQKVYHEKKYKKQSDIVDHNMTEMANSIFPPPPLSQELSGTIITDFCKDSKPERFEEAGCAVCGQLTPKNKNEPFEVCERFS